MFLACILAACEKNPDLSQLDNDNLVVTRYDTTVDFQSFSTYFVADSILFIGQSDLFISMLCLAAGVQAQVKPRSYYQIGWQFNSLLNNDFADKASGWGMYLEGGYYLTPHISLGGFINFHTNSEYVARQTISDGSMAVNTDQIQSVFQIPFGASFRYRFASETWQPYISAKAGANYSEATSRLKLYSPSDKSWGFYTSPEIGVNVFPFKQKRLGFNVAVYYSYATNRSHVFYNVLNGINNAGIRLGVTF